MAPAGAGQYDEAVPRHRPDGRSRTGHPGRDELSSNKPSSIRLIAFASLVGTTIEWYDFFLYNTAAALVFNKLFFPTFDPFVGTLLAFSTYTVGFVARPVGAVNADGTVRICAPAALKRRNNSGK